MDAIPEDQSLEQPEGEDLAKNEEDFSAGSASPSYVGKTLRALELLLVLFVSFGSKIVWALVHWQRGAVHFVFAEHYSVEGDVSGLLGYASSFGVLAYVLFRQGRGLKQLGLTADRRDVLPTLMLTAYTFAPYIVSSRLLYGSNYSGAAFHPLASLAGGMTLPPLYLLLILVGAANEELIARAYLMTEVVALCGSSPCPNLESLTPGRLSPWVLGDLQVSTIVAILASTCFQTLYHLYLGTPTALLSGCSFLFFSIYYAYRRRAMPVILSHFLYNFLTAGYRAYGA